MRKEGGQDATLFRVVDLTKALNGSGVSWPEEDGCESRLYFIGVEFYGTYEQAIMSTHHRHDLADVIFVVREVCDASGAVLATLAARVWGGE